MVINVLRRDFWHSISDNVIEIIIQLFEDIIVVIEIGKAEVNA